MTDRPILKQPTLYENEESQMAQYMRWLSQHGYPTFRNYVDLHAWSIKKIDKFWESIWTWAEIKHSKPPKKILAKRKMPGAKWFSGARLNFAENLLRPAFDGHADMIAITAVSECRARTQISYGELLEQVRRFSAFLKEKGVAEGDRVAAIASNGPEAIIGMLATTSIGAIWSSCSPDFGVQGILDRFGQIEPKILIAVDGYKYNGKEFSTVERIQKVCDDVSSIQAVIIISQLGASIGLEKKEAIFWDDIAEEETDEELSFAQLPFDHPIYILYSSGTTGVPKCIVHGAGGVLLQHAKELRLHTDLTEYDKFFYFTTCGWMMWNWLVSGLMVGAELLLFDGSPSYPNLGCLWEFAQKERMTVFGTSAKFIGSCRSAGLNPKEQFHLETLRTVLSTGSPLLPEDFDWIYNSVKDDVRLSSIAGGTDIVSCFILGNPLLPVRRGEIQCKGLGMAVYAYSPKGKALIDEQGELVCTEPSPSMPIYFWNDPKGEKYQSAYFDHFPGIWRHGDFIEFSSNGSCIIYGRSDATLNPGGVRIGTAEIYRQVETMDEVVDSLAAGRPIEGDEEVILFVVLKDGTTLNEDLEKQIRKRIKEGATPRHIPKRIMQIKEIPYTISGKKVELAVAKVIRGEKVENKDALANPDSLDQFQSIFE